MNEVDKLSRACCEGYTRSRSQSLYLNGEQHRQKLPLISDQHSVANQRHGLLNCILDRDGRDVLTSCCDD